jgi:gliding motility-associated-like protein
VVVNVSTPTVSGSNPASICPGGNVNLAITSNGISYAWSPATGLSCTNCPSPNASPTVTTTYTVVITDPNGCTASTSLTVTVANITVTCNAPSPICAGGNAQLNATSSATNYTWTPATGLSSTTISNPIASPTATTTYTVLASDPSGCSATTTVTVVVNPVPTASAGPNASYCAGGNTQLNATGGGTYSWTPSTGLSSTTIANPIASPTATTTYIVTVSNGQCTAADTVTVTVNQLPNVSAGNNTAICFGASTQLNASGGFGYSWTPATGLSSTTVNNPTSFPTATTTYTVVAVDLNGCSNTASVTVTINPLPTANAGPDVTICNGTNTQLTANGGGTYSWSPASSLSSTTAANPVATPTATTTYTVVVTNSFGCTASDNITVTIGSGFTLASAQATDQTCGNNDGTASAGTANGGNAPYTYSWNNGQTTSTATGLAAGNYTVVVTDANGCTNSQIVTVGQVLGVNAAASATPSTGFAPLNVVFGNSSAGGTNYVWNFGDGSPVDNSFAPSHTYSAPGTYTVILIVYNNSQQCADTVTLTIIVEDQAILTVPNVFTPNGDGHNDQFVITTKGIKTAHAVIFNRWGTIVADWDPMVTAWDGKGVVDGVYYYVVTATDLGDKVMVEKGFVQVLSNK